MTFFIGLAAGVFLAVCVVTYLDKIQDDDWAEDVEAPLDEMTWHQERDARDAYAELQRHYEKLFCDLRAGRAEQATRHARSKL